MNVTGISALVLALGVMLVVSSTKPLPEPAGNAPGEGCRVAREGGLGHTRLALGSRSWVARSENVTVTDA